MERKAARIRSGAVFLFVFFYHLAAAYAATEYLPERYLRLGLDVNGDLREDAVAQPKFSGDPAALLLGTGDGDPSLVWQRLEEIDPELSWGADKAALAAADFNGDGRDDLFVQGREAGSLQATLLAGIDGRFEAVHQKFRGDYMGFDWAADRRRAITGDFNGDGRGEVLLQGRHADDVHTVIRSDAAGTLNTTGPGWIDGYLGLRWNARDAELHSGDFNGDGRDDLLWRRLADNIRGNESAVALFLADSNGEFPRIDQSWDEDFLGADWDPSTHDILVRDVNGDGIADIILRARFPRGTHYLLLGRIDGRFTTVAASWQGDASAEAAWQNMAAGSAEVMLQAGQELTQDATAGQSLTGTSSITVTQSKSMPILGSSVVGTLPGDFSVDPTGAANYRIPIEVPPGVGGMQPDLAFLYSSRAGNGLLGTGWSLSGLSAIARCPGSMAQMGGQFRPVRFTNEDRFCLDGQLLKSVSGEYGDDGTVYGTEIASFQRIESKGGDNGIDPLFYTGPEHFIVKDKAGLVREYGTTSTSRQKVAGKQFHRQWSLSRIRDRFGNYIQFHYDLVDQENMRAYLPARISWHNRGGTKVGEVTFEYEDRPDVTRGSEPFSENANKRGNSLFKRLTDVRVYSGDRAVRHYRIEYTQVEPTGHSAIDSIRLCSPGGRCMRPTRFKWSPGKEGLASGAAQEVRNSLNATLAMDHKHFGDVNGDGRTDALFFSSQVLHWFDFSTGTHRSTGLNVGEFQKQEAIVMDYNRDGLDDLLIASSHNPQIGMRTWHVITPDADGNFQMHDTGRQALGWDLGPVPIDVDRDGYPELLFNDAGDLRFYRNGPNGFEAQSVDIADYNPSDTQRLLPIEYNGDGLPDVLVTSRSDETDGAIYVSTGNSLALKNWTFQTEKAVPVDWNGDGLTDLMAKGGSLGTDPDRWYRFFNVGGKFVASTVLPDESDDVYQRGIAMDWNGDGIPGVLVPATVWWIVEYDPADDTMTLPAPNLPILASLNAEFIPLEFDGNGVTDYLYKQDGIWKYKPGAGETPGLMIHAKNGLGDEQSVHYSHLNRANPQESVYAGHVPDDAEFEYYEMAAETQALIDAGTLRHALAPIPLVSAIEADTGVVDESTGEEGRIVTTYRYGGALIDPNGRGFLGFRMIRVKNSNTGIETVNLHRQEFPFTGMIEVALQKIDDVATTSISVDPVDDRCLLENGEPCGFEKVVETSIDPGKTVSRTEHTLAAIPGTQTADRGVYPYVDITVEKQFRFGVESGDPPLDRVVTTDYDYAPTVNSKVTGDPTQIVVTTTDGSGDDAHATTTDNVYAQNDISQHWCLGRLTQSDVTHTRQNYLQGNTALLTDTRRATFHYDETVRAGDEKSCRLDSETSNAQAAALALTKSYTFDAYGNSVTTTVTTADGQRETSQSYDHRGLYPLSTRNALGHEEHYVWDDRFGRKVVHVGPNGLATIKLVDDFGRVVKEIAPRSDVFTNHDFAWCAGTCASGSAVYRVRSISSAGSNAKTIMEYDSLGREVAKRSIDIHGRDIVNETVYDSLGRPYLVSLPYVKDAAGVGGNLARCWQHTIYDMLGRPKEVGEPVNDMECTTHSGVLAEDLAATPYGKVSEYQYAYEGNPFSTRVTAPGGRVKVTTKNVLDRVKAVTEFDGSTAISTQFDYDVFGNTTTVIPPDGGDAVVIGYDAAGRKISMSDPDMGDWTYAYNAFGELETQVDAKGNRVEMQYDKLGRMISREDIASGDVTGEVTEWTYDAGYGAGIGKLAYVRGPDGYQETYAYNEYGQPTDTVRLMDGDVYWTSQTYDEQGRPDILVYPDAESFDTAATPLAAVTLTVPATSDGSHEVSWTEASPYAHYVLHRAKDSTTFADASPVYSGPLQSFSDRVDADGNFHYWVESCHGDTCRTDGPAGTLVDLPPAPPAHLDVEDYDAENDGTVSLQWPASPDATAATEYKLEIRTASEDEFQSLTTVATTSHVAGGLVDGTYYFRVAACESGACSEYVYGDSASIVAHTPAAVAGGVNVVETPIINGEAALTWTPVPADYYEVELWTLDALGEREHLWNTYFVSSPGDEISGIPVGEVVLNIRACKIANAEPLCGPVSADSAPIDSGLRPASPAPVSAPTVDADGSVVVTFTNPNDTLWHDDNFELKEADNAAFDGARVLAGEPVFKDTCVEGPGGEPRCSGPQDAMVASSSGLKWYAVRICNGSFGCSEWAEISSPVDVQVAPGKPKDFHAPTLSGTGDFTVSWGDPQGGGTADKYELYESAGYFNYQDHGNSPPPADAVRIVNGPAQSKDVTGKLNTEEFSYGVRACYKGECGPFTGTDQSVQIAFPPEFTSSFVPPELVFTDPFFLDWPEPQSSINISDYILEESEDENFGITVVVPEDTGCVPLPEGGCRMANLNEATVDGRDDGTYYYRVKACNAGGCSGWLVGTRPTEVLYKPGKPSGITVPSDSAGDYTITWGLSTNEVDNYELQRSTSSDFDENVQTYAPTGLTRSFSGQADGRYYFRVRGCNRAGCSGWREGANWLDVLNVPGKPGTLHVPSSNSTGDYTVSWNPASGFVEEYKLQEATSSNFSGASNLNVPNQCIDWQTDPDGASYCKQWASDTYKDINNQADDTYYYRVRACNDSGCSGWRNGSNAVTVDKTPGRPPWIDSPDYNGDGSYTVTWGASSGPVTAYKLYESADGSGYYHIYTGSARTKSVTNSNGTYTYRVKACNGSYCSSYRSGASTTVYIDPRGGGGCNPICQQPQSNPLDGGDTAPVDGEPAPADTAPTESGDGTPESTPTDTGDGGLTTGMLELEPAQPLASAASSPTFAAAANRARHGLATKVATNVIDHDREGDFRAMPPMRPGAFYRSLVTPASRQRAAHARPPEPARSVKASRNVSLNAAVSTSTTRYNAPPSEPVDSVGIAPVEPVAPLRDDPRIRTQSFEPADNTTKTSSTRTTSDGFTAMKFGGVTNEPAGTYAHAIQNRYDPVTGALIEVRECVTLGADDVCTGGQVYWTATEVNELGAVTKTSLGNGLETLTSYNRAGGTVSGIQATAGSTDVQSLTFSWDLAGNLTGRTDTLINAPDGGGITQTFQYDSLHRLKSSQTDYNQAGINDDERFMRYQANGNIACFNVDASSTCSETNADYGYHADKLHAVTSTSGGGSYTYDLNGSMLTGPNRTVSWTVFNKVDRITNTASHAFSEFVYGPDRARYKHVQGTEAHDTNPETVLKTTYYAGSLYERVVDNVTGEALHRYHIFAGGSAIAVYTCTDHCGEDPEGDTADGTRDETLYLLRDHLGSISVTVDGKGAVVERFSYTAWGEQQVWNDTTDVFDAYTAPPDQRHTRGFTGHEMLSELGLVHMNGRIYDQNLGRFISADPFVQFPHSTQGYNRYTYVGNNPLSYTDPSGYFSLKKELGNFLGHVAGYLSLIPGCQLWCSAIAGAVSGYLLTGSFKGAVLGGLSGLASGAMVQWGKTNAFGDGFTGWLKQAATGGAIAGGLSAAGGGRFGDGFLSGFAGTTAGVLSGGNPIAAAILGGTVSKIGGGKFASGAKSGFFHSLLAPSLSRTLSNGGVRDGGAGFFQNLWEDVKTAFGVVETRAMSSQEVSNYYPEPDKAPGKEFDTQKQAATVALDGMLSATGDTGWEWAASIRRLPNNKWTFDIPVTSHLTTRVYVDRILLSGYEGLAHTHPISSSFSDHDYMFGRKHYVEMWLTGPNGTLHHWWPAKFEGPEGYAVYPGTFEPLWER